MKSGARWGGDANDQGANLVRNPVRLLSAEPRGQDGPMERQFAESYRSKAAGFDNPAPCLRSGRGRANLKLFGVAPIVLHGARTTTPPADSSSIDETVRRNQLGFAL